MTRYSMRLAAAGLATVMASAAMAASARVDADITTLVDLHNVVFGYEGPTDTFPAGVALDDIPAGHYEYHQDLDGVPEDYMDYTYTLFATYGDTDSGVVIALNEDAAADAEGTSFFDYFGQDESTVAGWINGAHDGDFLSTLSLASFYQENKSRFSTVGTSPFIKWSDGSYAGSMTTEVVPEPTTMAVLGLGGLALIRRRRKS